MENSGTRYVSHRLILVLVVIVLALILFAIGLGVGYGVIGDGKYMWSILSPDKWRSIIEKFTGK